MRIVFYYATYSIEDLGMSQNSVFTSAQAHVERRCVFNDLTMFENLINIKLQYYEKCEFNFNDESKEKASYELFITRLF